MRSWWERRAFGEHDVVVVGAGIVGLSTALAVRTRRPTARILVLERGLLPTGASTRAAGFACFGSLTELVADVASHGLDATVALVDRRRRGLLALRERLGDAAIAYRPSGGWELLPDASALDALAPLDAALRPVFGGPVLVPDDDRLSDFGFGHTAHLVALPHEGALDPARVVDALLRACRAADVAVWTGARVASLEEGEGGVALVVDDLVLRAGQVVVATNALARELLPGLDVTPGRGQVLLTEPVPGLPFSGVFHRDEGYVYFRDVEGRVLLGGGRNVFREAETTDAHAVTEEVQAWLEGVLHGVVLPGRSVRIEARWAGIMAFGPERAPIVRRVSDRVVAAVRLGGMGVALGTLVGDEAAALLDGGPVQELSDSGTDGTDRGASG